MWYPKKQVRQIKQMKISNYKKVSRPQQSQDWKYRECNY